MIIRVFQTRDATAVDALALKAFEQYSAHYKPWEEFRGKIGHMSMMPIEIILAEKVGKIAGAVGFVAPGKVVDSHFDPQWAVIRMLVVDPVFRGQGLGRKLTEACLERAKSLGCRTIGLHTSPIMEVALSLYLRMGFIKRSDIADIYGVPYGIYTLELE
ncbi:MAG: GNAT family N-acetyltransferase [Deltaproteobacteria bacterium]|nr:GNAT family N-acetyltransferase [Deltaproteobacteria bacterium]